MPVLKQSTSSYTPVPDGTHPCRCYGYVSLGTQKASNPQYSDQFKVLILLEFPNETITINGETKPMTMTHFLNAYLGNVRKPSKTNLFLTSWRGRQFTEQELAGFDLGKIVGAPAIASIVHETKNGKTREVITSMAPLIKGMTIPPQFHDSVKYEIEDGRNDVFQKLAPWIQTMIGECVEWNAPVIAAESHEDTAADAEVAQTAKADDNVPF